MGKTSAAVKNRYNNKTYDRINLTVKKGEKQIIKTHAESNGMSLNGYIKKLIDDDIGDKLKNIKEQET